MAESLNSVPMPHTMPCAQPREQLLAQLAQPVQYDVAVIGGGATGLGVALDAAARGYKVVLVESHDFAGGTSSRSTKLLHGGVRYLAQGNVHLVREALHERSAVLANAPHLAQPLPFVMPAYAWWQKGFYGLGLKAYDLLAGRAGLGSTEFLSVEKTLSCLPNLKHHNLSGGVKYWDAQFDDARLAIALARTAASRGALLVNYCAATKLIHEAGRLVGLHCEDKVGGQRFELRAHCVINAAGVWVDDLRLQDGAMLGRDTQAMVAPSQGVHLVVEREFMPSNHALLVPHTADGRVLFAVPWLGKLVLGTTDTPRHDLDREPKPFGQEIEFILRESAKYLAKAPTRADVKSVWVGLRPLVKPRREEGERTKALSREHTVLVSRSGLVTVTGGKWTTYRVMAEDVLARCFKAGLLPTREQGVTRELRLVGAPQFVAPPSKPQLQGLGDAPGPHLYGAEAAVLANLTGAKQMLAPGLSEAMVRFAAKYEYVHTVEDMLARRSRLLFLDAKLAEKIASKVGEILREETGLDPQVDAFAMIAAKYLWLPE